MIGSKYKAFLITKNVFYITFLLTSYYSRFKWIINKKDSLEENNKKNIGLRICNFSS